MKDNLAEYCKMFGSMIAIVFILLIAVLLSGCSKTVYVPVENTTVKTDSAYKAVYTDRLVIERDTVNTYTKGDTVFRDVVRWRVRNVESHDTVWQAKTDSICIREPYPVEVVREVKKPLGWWQTAFIWIGAFFTAALFVLLGVFVRKKLKL